MNDKEHKSQGKRFDLAGIINSCNFNACRIFVLRNDASEYQYEIDAETDRELYGMLSKPDAAGVEYIRANFCRVEWNYYDRGMFQLRVEFDVEEDSVHFHYDHFGLKLKYTLINILKSQSEWHCIGIAMYDNESGDIADDAYYADNETEDDTWIHGFEQLCDEYIVNSCHASLFKAEEEEDGRTVDILDIIIDTETCKQAGDALKKEDGSLYVPNSFLQAELAGYEDECSGHKVMCWDNDEGEPYYLTRVERLCDDSVCIFTSLDESEALDVAALSGQLRQYEEGMQVCIVNLDEELMELAHRSPYFSKDYDNVGNEVIACYTVMEENDN